jgi:hypothetical protein
LFSALFMLAAIAWHGGAAVSQPKPKFGVELLRVPNGGIQPEAVCGSNGVVHLIYYSGDPARGDLYYVKSSDEGRSWTQPLRVNSQDLPSLLEPSVAGRLQSGGTVEFTSLGMARP